MADPQNHRNRTGPEDDDKHGAALTKTLREIEEEQPKRGLAFNENRSSQWLPRLDRPAISRAAHVSCAGLSSSARARPGQ